MERDSPRQQIYASVDSPKMSFQHYEQSAASDGVITSREVNKDMQRLVFNKFQKNYERIYKNSKSGKVDSRSKYHIRYTV